MLWVRARSIAVPEERIGTASDSAAYCPAYRKSVLRIEVRSGGDLAGLLGWLRYTARRYELEEKRTSFLIGALLAVIVFFALALPALVLVVLLLVLCLGRIMTALGVEWGLQIFSHLGQLPATLVSGFISRPSLWAIGVMTLILTLALFLRTRAQIFTIDVHFLDHGEPLPRTPSPAKKKSANFVLAVRLLEPNVRKLVERLLRRPLATHSESKILDFIASERQNRVERMPPEDRRFANDVWMLVRLVLSRVLAEISGEPNPPTSLGKHGFAFKLHLPQLKIFAALILYAFSLTICASILDLVASLQIALVFGTAGFCWALFSAKLHREQQKAIERWEGMSAGKPFGGCPMFAMNTSWPPIYRWEELAARSDFRVPILDYGISFERFLHIALSIMLVAYLALLQLIK